MVGHKAGSVCNPEPTVFTLGAGDGGDRRMRFFRTWLQGMNAKRRYASYDEYLAHQKTKTLDPIRREKWLGEEWRSQLDGFKSIFRRNAAVLQGRSDGRRVGQEWCSTVETRWLP